jgi:glucose-6-phosphate 1-dehydrogenase
MSKYIVKILKTEFIAHNVKRFVVEKPTGYNFISGQATDVSINTPALEEESLEFRFADLFCIIVPY